MKSFLPLVSLTLVFAGCTTAYKSGQTPDDVYFSPERPQAEYVTVKDKEEDRYYSGESNGSSSDYYNYEEERYLRMKVRNRQRWSYLDNDFYSYNPYVYSYPGYYNNPWNSYSYWNHYYNPYYNPYGGPVMVYNAKSPVYNRPRTINLRTFNTPNNTSINPRVYNYKSGSTNSNNRSNTAPRRNVGNELRNIFNSGSSNDSYSSPSPSPNRSSTNSSSSSGGSSSGSSSSGSSSAPSRRF